MPHSEMSRKLSSLTVPLDTTLLTQLEEYALQNKLNVPELVEQAIRTLLAREASRPTKKLRTLAVRHEEAPLDAFLPEGVDPFAPAEQGALAASSFEDIQTRMRFAGTPSLLREL